MIKRFLALVTVMVALSGANAQQASLRGSVKDTVNFKPMAYSAVSLIRWRDSILVKHKWVNEQETFRFDSVPPDTYFIQVTRTGYADYDEKLFLHPGEMVDVGTIQMISKLNLLKEVIIREKANAIRIKGDTTEFLVDSFLTNKNANVEDLLKKLPGLQVDKDGKIMAQGQEVKKVLVDGEEFFGDDPTVATRNLRADNVEKVQVFDKKSDQAAFSGIDDGVKEKTINLQLKEDAKKGYFGKATAGVGTRSRYEHEAMANLFRNKMKVSAYGALTNTNKTRMNWDDANKYGGGGGDNYEVDESSGFMYFYGSSDMMNFDGIGIPQTWYAGAHFSDKVQADRHAYSFNLSRKELNSSGYDNYYNKYILPDTLYYVNQLRDVKNARSQTSANGSYEWKPDSFSTFKIKANIKSGTQNNIVTTNSENINGNGLLVYRNIRTNRSNTSTTNEDVSFSWNRKFRTTGRSLMTQASHKYYSSEGESFIESGVNFFDSSGAVVSSSNIDQRKSNNNSSNVFSGKLAYTEPLSKIWFLVMDYEGTVTLSKSSLRTMAKSNGEYNTPVDSLSNTLDYDIFSNKGGIALRLVRKKINFSFGGKASYTDMSQTQSATTTTFNRQFRNFFPSVSFNYKLRQTANMNFGYNGATRQPSIQQIQPIQDVTNPLDIYIGNQNLSQSFQNSFNLFYYTYKPISGSSFYTSMNYTFTNNDFTSFDRVDAFGRKTHQTVNVNGNSSYWGVAYYYFSVKKLNLRFGSSVNPSMSTNVNYINGLKNTNKSMRLGFGQNINFELEKKVELTLDADWYYNNGRSSLRPDVVTTYWTQVYTLYGELFLPQKFSVTWNGTYNIRQKTSAVDQNTNTLILGAGIKKKFLKSEALVVGISGSDLLNQNLGFDRNVSSNYVNEHVYSVLKNYYLLTVTWNFTKGPVVQDED